MTESDFYHHNLLVKPLLTPHSFWEPGIPMDCLSSLIRWLLLDTMFNLNLEALCDNVGLCSWHLNWLLPQTVYSFQFVLGFVRYIWGQYMYRSTFLFVFAHRYTCRDGGSSIEQGWLTGQQAPGFSPTQPLQHLCQCVPPCRPFYASAKIQLKPLCSVATTYQLSHLLSRVIFAFCTVLLLAPPESYLR